MLAIQRSSLKLIGACACDLAICDPAICDPVLCDPAISDLRSSSWLMGACTGDPVICNQAICDPAIRDPAVHLGQFMGKVCRRSLFLCKKAREFQKCMFSLPETTASWSNLHFFAEKFDSKLFLT